MSEEKEKEAILEAARNPEAELTKVERELTFGEKLVGLTFNPSKDPKIDKAKALCAELADLLYDDMKAKGNVSGLAALLQDKAVGNILDAQMNVVKCLTFKY